MLPHNTYDLLPYRSHPFLATHPNCIGAIARLAGVAAAAPSHARVLELACASGGNLIPMAVQFPAGRYLGIDLSERQIESGRAIVDALGLKNIVLRHASITELLPDLGQFDYIIAHGVHSWVAADVQAALLRVCRENLAPNGVAYISYNTMPGWHLKRMFREMLLHHVRGLDDLRDRVPKAREFSGFLAANLFDADSPYAAALRRHTQDISNARDDYLAHEYLEGANEPLYFTQFLEGAKSAGLRYLAESPLRSVTGDQELRAGPLAALRQWAPDPLERQQYLDFLEGTTFRRSLLTHRERNVDWTKFGTVPDGLLLSGRFTERPGSRPGEVEFESQGGGVLRDLAPAFVAVIRHLTAIWPQSCPFSELVEVAAHETALAAGRRPGVPEAVLRMMLGRLSLSRGVQMTIEPWPFVSAAGERPIATPLARWQAAKGESPTSQAHLRVKLDDRSARVLALCDGSRTRERIAEEFAGGLVGSGGTLSWNGEEITDPLRLRAVAGECVAKTLVDLAGQALLIA